MITVDAALKAIFEKRDLAVTAGSRLNTQRSKKRKQAKSSEPTADRAVSIEAGAKLPDFLNRPVNIEEDPTPCEVK